MSDVHLGLLVQYQLPISVQRDLGAGIAIHADLALLCANFVGDVIAQHFLGFVIYRLATLLRRSVGIIVLHMALNLITCIPARQSPRHRGNILVSTTADLMAQDATGHRAEHRFRQTILILHRTTMSYVDITALLMRCFQRFFIMGVAEIT